MKCFLLPFAWQHHCSLGGVGGGAINTTSWFPTLELEETLLTLERAGGGWEQVCGHRHTGVRQPSF